MAKPVSIFGKDLQTNVRQRNKLSHLLLAMSSVIALFAFQQAGAVEVNNDNQPQKASPVLQSIIDAARQSATESYEQDDHGLNSKLKEIDYTTYRSIRFKPSRVFGMARMTTNCSFFTRVFYMNTPSLSTLLVKAISLNA